MADRNDVKVAIGGNNAGLAAALKDSDRLVSQFARNATGGLRAFTAGFGSALKSALSFNAIVGTIAGTAGLGLLIKSSIESADAIAKMADRTGLGVEALQELQYAAGLAGVDADKFGRAMERLNVAVGESGRGTGEAREAFKALGISVRDNDGRLKSNERVFNELADAIGRTESATARADAVNKIFGQRLGGQLLPLFKDGAGGIEALRREARELGVVLDTVMVREAEKAGDQLERVGTIIRTNLTRAVLALTPSILALSEAFISGLQPAVQWLIQHLPNSAVAADELRRRYNELADTLERMTGMSFQDVLKLPGLSVFGEQADEIRKLLINMKELGAALEERERKEALYTAAIEGSGDATSEFAAKIADLRKELQFESDQLSRSKAEQKLYELAKKAGVEVNDQFAAGLLPLIRSIEGEKDAIKEAADKWKEYEDRVKSVWDTQRSRGQAIFEETRTEAEKYQATLTELNDLLAAGAISQETYARAVEKAQDDMAGSGRDLKDVFKDVNVSMSNAFADAILEGKKFGDVIDGLVKDIGRLIIQTALLNAVRQGASALGGMFGFGGDSAGGGGLTIDQGGTPGALIPSAKGNAFSGGRVIPFARGGILSSPIAFAMAGGNTGVAGEAGEEVIAPIGRDSQGRMGIRATAANVTVNITTPPGTTARSETRDDGRGGKTIDVMIDEAVAGNIGNQGSRTSRALRSMHGLTPVTVGR